VLVVGAGPSGLECALSLGRRGYEVTLAEATDEIGGRLRFETRLPGLTAWGRVVDWRRGQIERLTNVNIYRGNRLSAAEILELQAAHVVIATGAHWARLLYSALEIPAGELSGPGVFTPDDIAAGTPVASPVVVYDFDNYYMGSALAEHLARSGHKVSYVTPAGHASAWGIMSNEQPQVHRALASAGIALHTLSRVSAFAELMTRAGEFADAGIRSVTRIGDALAPGAIVHAVYSGHRYAEELDAEPAAVRYRRDAPLARQV